MRDLGGDFRHSLSVSKCSRIHKVHVQCYAKAVSPLKIHLYMQVLILLYTKPNQRSIRSVVLFSLSVEVRVVSDIATISLVVSFSRQVTSHTRQAEAANYVCCSPIHVLADSRRLGRGRCIRDARSTRSAEIGRLDSPPLASLVALALAAVVFTLFML